MPELPEVETVRRALAACLTGHSLSRVTVRRQALRRPLPEGLADRLRGQRLTGFGRRGKYLLLRLDGGDSLLVHLGMSGRVLVRRAGAAAAEHHEHLTLLTQGGLEVGFIDPRRFGLFDLLPTAAEARHPLLAHLGPEPLEEGFTGSVLAAALAGRRMALKPALLDQRLVAGLGNIYVCEALFAASLSPFRPAGSLSADEALCLAQAIKSTLAEAIAAGGSSLRDYVHPDGGRGYFQHAWKVYGRQGAPCRRCPGPKACPGIRRIIQSGRSTFFCAQTQK